ncbi:MAG TPA: trigger factor [bacterium]|nr:trigger factor [bacterium]
MKYEITEEKDCLRKINVVLDKEDVDAVREKVFKNIKNNAQLDGFRKGKAPDDVVRTKFATTIEEEVQKEIIPKTASDVLKESGIHIVTYPAVREVKTLPEGGMTFIMFAEVNAEFELSDYKKMKIDVKKPREIKDDDVDREIDRIRQSRGTLKDSEGKKVKEGDYVNISMAGAIDGKAEPGLTGDNQLILIGAKTIPDSLEDALKTMAPGDEKDVNVKFPEDYPNKNYAGREAVIKTGLKGIKVLDIPEANDEFVKSLGGKYQTLDELKNAIKEQLKAQAETEAKNSNIEGMFKWLLENNSFDVARGLVEDEVNNIVARYENNLRSRGLTPAAANINMDEIRKNSGKTAEDNVRLRYILRKTAEAEKIEVSDADVEAEIKKIAENTGGNADELLKRAKASWDALKAQLLEDKIIEKLLEVAGVKK